MIYTSFIYVSEKILEVIAPLFDFKEVQLHTDEMTHSEAVQSWFYAKACNRTAARDKIRSCLRNRIAVHGDAFSSVFLYQFCRQYSWDIMKYGAGVAKPHPTHVKLWLPTWCSFYSPGLPLAMFIRNRCCLHQHDVGNSSACTKAIPIVLHAISYAGQSEEDSMTSVMSLEIWDLRSRLLYI